MNKGNSIEAIDRANSADQTEFRLSELSKIEKYFNSEIKEKKLNSKEINKYAAAFDYIDQMFIVLSAASSDVSIVSFTTAIGAPVVMASASFILIFSLTTGIIKKLLITTRNKKKKHDKVLVLAKSRLNSIETLASQALVDMDISHKEFITFLNEKDKYKKMTERLEWSKVVMN